MKLNKQQRLDRVTELAGKWLLRCRLANIALTIKEKKVIDDAPEVAAMMSPDLDYLRATLSFTSAVFDPAEDTNHIICHELVHLLLSPLGDWVTVAERHIDTSVRDTQRGWWHKAQEQVTEHVTLILLAAEAAEAQETAEGV